MPAMDDKQQRTSEAPAAESLLAELAEAVLWSPAEFQLAHPHYFLLRSPKTALISSTRPETDVAFEYRTTSLQVSGDGLHPWQWWIAAIIKRKGAPFPNRLAVGRADSCDIQIRFRFVSKLHARFHLEDGVPTSLEDAGSANGTFVNGQKLTPGQTVKVRSGDRIGFGSLSLELLSPTACQSSLRARQAFLPGRESSTEGPSSQNMPTQGSPPGDSSRAGTPAQGTPAQGTPAQDAPRHRQRLTTLAVIGMEKATSLPSAGNWVDRATASTH
jgi:pSer/pThr/pTyr-binding forkhead associated (FHA) protein